MEIMSAEKTTPVGTAVGATPMRVGTHMNTKVYMAPSESACVSPTTMICLLESVALHPSLNCARNCL
jgi:hypothetical protein